MEMSMGEQILLGALGAALILISLLIFVLHELDKRLDETNANDNDADPDHQ